jgi:alpha-D-xyloside xylohydrolase
VDDVIVPEPFISKKLTMIRDIGGFHGGDPNNEEFRELFVRWFQWGTFCPVMRLHGDREPRQPQHGSTGGATCRSGAANEVWSYGEEVYEICKKFLRIREDLRDYTRRLMAAAHENGTPVMRTCFFEFPDDEQCWKVEDQYMYGDTYLVAPVLYPGQRKRDVYFPQGSWMAFEGDKSYDGGQYHEVECPLESMPVFTKASS